MVTVVEAAPKRSIQSKQTSFRIGTQPQGQAPRGGSIMMCDETSYLVSDSLDLVTVTPGNSINCYGGSGTPEHSYGRSYDLSQGSTAGLALELSCIHFALAQNSVEGTATVSVFLDLDSVAGPLPDGSDLWPLGSIQRPIPATESPVFMTADAVTPYPLDPNALILEAIAVVNFHLRGYKQQTAIVALALGLTPRFLGSQICIFLKQLKLQKQPFLIHVMILYKIVLQI
jgi:hypothetical protein